MAVHAGVTFELQRLELKDDTLVVSGFWSGVRGLRFVRPTLLSDERRILATLEHKPWLPADDAPWIAAFPWDGDEVDAGGLALAVGSKVTVPLGDAPEPEPPSGPAETDPAPDATTRERDDLRRRLDDAKQLAAERKHRAERDRDRILEQLAEAVEAREAAVRTRARMELAHDDSLRAREDAEIALANAKRERDEANAQRDEVLLAYRALQRQLRAERAQEDRDRVAGDAEAEVHDDDAEAGIATGADEPIGVRSVPAARTVMSELQDPRREAKLLLSQFDLWVIRVLGTVAACCFILLLVSILRVFV